ncbi:DUF3572 family protein [Dongia sp.]|uniref:DUF3572 family protein n=1 Tax=Dongia sp. TaxID=1977262 RepID=UPI0035AE866F
MLLKSPKSPPPDPEALALQALAFLTADEDRLSRFLGLTGLQGGQLREIARDPNGLGAVLDYLLGFEPLLLEFAAEIAVDPAIIASQRRKLPA